MFVVYTHNVYTSATAMMLHIFLRMCKQKGRMLDNKISRCRASHGLAALQRTLDAPHPSLNRPVSAYLMKEIGYSFDKCNKCHVRRDDLRGFCGGCGRDARFVTNGSRRVAEAVRGRSEIFSR